MHRIEDDARGVCKADPRGWGQYFKWPTPEEQANWIKAMVATGRKRSVFMCSPYSRKTMLPANAKRISWPRNTRWDAALNEKAMKVYDNMIAEADKQGLRLILPFIDHWWWWGARATCGLLQ
jgi:hypothetical protein